MTGEVLSVYGMNTVKFNIFWHHFVDSKWSANDQLMESSDSLKTSWK